MAKKTKRTTLRSSAGKKLYAVRGADGSFKDIQTFERAHRADLAKTSKAEAATARKTARKKAGRKTAKKKTARKTARRGARKASRKKS